MRGESPPSINCLIKFRRLSSAEGSRFCMLRNLLDNLQDLNSDGEDEEEFVPSKKELQSSEEEEEEEDEEEEEEAGLDSDDDVVYKKGRRAAAGPRTPRSKQRIRSSTRTPQRTPNRKVKSWQHASATETDRRLLFPPRLLLNVRCLGRSHPARRALLTAQRPASPAGRCRPGSRPMFWRRPERGETHRSVTSDPQIGFNTLLFKICSCSCCVSSRRTRRQ